MKITLSARVVTVGLAAAVFILAIGSSVEASIVFDSPDRWITDENGVSLNIIFRNDINPRIWRGSYIANVMVGSNDLPDDTFRFSFTYSQDWVNTFTYFTPERIYSYNQGMLLGGSAGQDHVSQGASYVIGMLTIDTRNLPAGDYVLKTLGSRVYYNDQVWGTYEDYNVNVQTTIHVPEPMTLSLLIFGGLSLVHRRKS